jgi:hypothetical protein
MKRGLDGSLEFRICVLGLLDRSMDLVAVDVEILALRLTFSCLVI